MRGSGFESGISSPFRIVPQFGKLPDHGSPVSCPSIIAHIDAWYVLQQDESGLHFANDPECVGPEVSVVVEASFACHAVGLAREPCGDEVSSVPWSSVKGFDVVPNGGVIEVPVSDVVLYDGLTVGVLFDVTYCPAVDASEPKPERKPGVPGEETEFGVYIHVMIPLSTCLRLYLCANNRRLPDYQCSLDRLSLRTQMSYGITYIRPC